MRSTLFLISVLVLCACSHSSDSSGGASNPSPATPGPVTKDTQNVTDTSACFGPPAPGISIYSTWHVYFASPNFRTDLAFMVGPNSVTVTNNCTAEDGTTLDASVTVPARIDGNTLTVLRSDARTERRDFGDRHITCTVTIAAASGQFSFAGNCLKLTNNGKSGFMVP